MDAKDMTMTVTQRYEMEEQVLHSEYNVYTREEVLAMTDYELEQHYHQLEK